MQSEENVWLLATGRIGNLYPDVWWLEMVEARLSDLIREERLKSGYSREQLAALTRVPCDFITAIEEENWDVLPATVFCRGFLRIIWRELRIEDTKIIATCERFLHSREVEPEVPAHSLSLGKLRRPRTNKKKFFLKSSILVGIGLFALLFHDRFPLTSPTQPPPKQNHPVSASAEVEIPAPPLQTAHPADSRDTKPASVKPQSVRVVVEKPVQMQMSFDGGEETQKSLFLPKSYTFNFTQEGRFIVYDTSAVKIWFNGERVSDLARGGRQRTLVFKNRDTL